MDVGIRINPYGAGGGSGQSPGGSRRSRHQEKLKALAVALRANDVAAARQAYHELIAFNPSLADSGLKRVGDAVASANLAAARKAFEEIYGQGQLIFGRPPAAPPAAPHAPLRDDHGVLVDTSA